MKNPISITHGKIILIGEHSVVYNKPAIAVPFLATDLRVYIEKNDENELDCSFYYGKLDQTSDDLSGLRYIIENFLSEYEIKEKINNNKITKEKKEGKKTFFSNWFSKKKASVVKENELDNIFKL